MPEASLVVTMKETVSDKLKTIAGATKAFNKDVEDLQIKLKTLDRRQDDLADSMDVCRKKVKEYRKEFEETGSALSKMKLDDARDELRAYSRDLGEVKRESKETEKALRGMKETAGKSGWSKMLDGLKDTTRGMAVADIGQLVAQSVGEGVNALASSAFGTDGGDMVSSVLGGAISGGTMGAVAGVPGVIAGAVFGSISGAISAETRKFTKQDDYFKSYYNGIIDQQAQQRTSDIQTGSSIAAGREKDKVSFTTLFGNNEAVADKYLKDLVVMSNTTPFLYDDLTAMSKTLATYGYGPEGILPVLTKIGDAGAALNLSESQAATIVSTLEARAIRRRR